MFATTLWTRPKAEYKGLIMHCAPGTHEAAVSLLVRHGPRRSRILDLGAGSGAMLARLRDLGFSDLHAAERDAATVGLDGVGVHVIDLNTEFSRSFDCRFAVIVASEIVEHLDCSRNFLRQVRSLLEDGGHLVLTTPNVASWVGRLKFLLSGELRWFDERMYHELRHISPITDVQMRLMLRETGFRLVGSTSAGTFFGPVKRMVTAPISGFFVAAYGLGVLGDSSIYLATTADDG